MEYVSCVESVGKTHSAVFTETKRKIFWLILDQNIILAVRK
jgi:hypothetical protein